MGLGKAGFGFIVDRSVRLKPDILRLVRIRSRRRVMETVQLLLMKP
jgi:hypothetical protein